MVSAQVPEHPVSKLVTILVRVAETGEVPEGVDPGEVGRFLAGLIQGTSYLARSQASPRHIDDFVSVGLSLLT